MKKKTANRPKLVAKATTFAALKVGLRKNSSRSTGSGDAPLDQHERDAERRAATTKSATIHQVP